MKKIRINVLARELEVKSHLILELLPDLGVDEKLTHSSSIDEDVADKLRVRFGIAPSGNGEGPSEADEGDAHHAVTVEEEPAPAPPEIERHEPAPHTAPAALRECHRRRGCLYRHGRQPVRRRRFVRRRVPG